MNYRRVSVRPILSILLILVLLCAVFTLAACSDKKIDAVAIEVVQDTIPDVATVGAFEVSQLKLKVTSADGSEQEIAVTLSMLDTESKKSLKEPGEKNINVFYQGQATNFTIFLVEEGTKTVSVTFLGQDSTVLAKKYAVAGDAIEAPQAPAIEGLMFDSWRNRDNSQEVDLSSVSSNLVVYAHYTENAARYTVKFYDYNKNLVETYENIPHNSTITAPNWDKPSAIKSYTWNWDFINQKVTQNTSIYMTVVYDTCDVNFQYAFSEDGQRFNLFTKKSVERGKALSNDDLQDAIDEMAEKNIEWIKWLNADKLATNTAKEFTIIALAKSYTYKVEFIDQDHATDYIDSGQSFTMPLDCRHREGHEFAGQWEDENGVRYTAGNSYQINANLKLKAVYTKVQNNIKFIFNFEELEDEDGNMLSQEVIRTVSDIDINAEYLEALLEELKQENTANYEIKSFGKQGDDYVIVCEDAEQRLSYVLDGNGYIVDGYNPPAEQEILLNIEIANKYNDKPVVGIADGVFSSSVHGYSLKINTLTLPDSLLAIGKDAFNGATFLKDITIPSKVSSLGEGAFMNASTPLIEDSEESQERIEISVTILGDALTAISKNAFYGFLGLQNVVLPSSVTTISQSAFAECKDLNQINLDDVISIQESAFDNCIVLGDIGSLANVADIADFAFRATAIVDVSLDNLTSIGTQVFLMTEKLNTLEIGTLADGTITFDFANIMGSNVKTLILGSGVTALTNTIGEKFASIGKLDASGVYAISKLTAISFAKEIENIDVSTFNQFPRIKTVDIVGESDYVVDTNALFKGDTLIYYPPGVYGDYVVPNKVNGVDITKIANDAFVMANLYKLVLQENISEIGNTNCAMLSLVEMSLATLEVLFGQSVELTESVSIQDILDTLDAKFADGVTYYINSYEEADEEKVDALVNGANGRFIVELGAVSSYFDEQSRLLYTVDNDIATVIGGDKTVTAIAIPATLGGYTVSYIRNGAFNGYADLKELHIEAILNNLALSSDTFAGCVSLEEITLAGLINVDNINYNLFNDTKLYSENAIIILAGIPVAYNRDFTTIKESNLEGATIIPKEFFKGCDSLEEITLPNSIIEINDNAFEGCNSLTTINLNAVTKTGKYIFKDCTALESIVIPLAINDGSLSLGMFYGCANLTSVTMDEVNRFGHDNGKSYAFYGCESLVDISFLYGFMGIIYENAFDGCSSITAVNLTVDASGNTTDKFTEIRANAFANCTSLVYLEFGTISVLGANAFNNTALETIRIKGAGGIFAKGQTIAIGVFPADVILYIDNVDSSVVNNVLANYPNRTMVEPRITFEMLNGYAAGSNELNMVAVSASYLETAPQAPQFDDYVFVNWFVEVDGVDVKAQFPMTFKVNTTLKAKYFSTARGSIVDGNLELIKDNKYRLASYSSQDDIAYIPYEYRNDDNKICYIQEIDLSIFATTSIKRLVIPEGVTKLTGTLNGSLVSYIKIASSVTDITSANAFTNMSNLDIEWANDSNLINASLSAFVGSKWYKDTSNKAKTGFNNRFVIAGRLAIEYIPAPNSTDKIIKVHSEVLKLNDNLFSVENSSLYAAVTTVTFNDELKFIGSGSLAGLTNLITINYHSIAANSAIENVTLNAFPSSWVEKQNQIIVGKIFLKYRGIFYTDKFTLAEHITTIAPSAFENAKIKEIVFSNNVTTIGDYAFRNSDLQKIVLPASINSMGEGVFQGCKDLQTADLSAANMTELPIATFSGCTNLLDLKLSNKVTKIGANSLQSCAKLRDISANGLIDTTGLNLSGLASTAWYRGTNQEKGSHLVLGKVYVKYVVGSNPDKNDDGLIEVEIPEGVVVILSEAFMGVADLGKVIIPQSVQTIEANSFKNTLRLEEVVIAANSELETIGDGAFAQTKHLTEITLPQGLVTIGRNAFDGSMLKSIMIPHSVTTIGERAFADNKLETVVLGKGLNSIGANAFAGNNELYKVEWSLEVVKMNNEIDNKINVDTVKQLYYMYLASKTESDEYSLTAQYVDGIFSRSSLIPIRLYIPSEAYVIVTSGIYEYLSIWVDSNNKYFEIIKEGELPEVSFDQDGYIMQSFRTELIEEGFLKKPSKTNHTFKYWEVNGQEVTFPYHVKGDVEFVAVWESNQKSYSDRDGEGYIDGLLYEGNIADGVEVSYNIIGIREELSVMYVPSTLDDRPIVGFNFEAGTADNVKKIIFTKASNFFRLETNIFAAFTNLEWVELYDTNMSNINYKVENGAMYSIDGKELVAYFIQKTKDDKIITEFEIPEGVEKILPNAFINSGLSSITIPNTVTSIGKLAFNDDIENLEFASDIFLTDVTRESVENTIWYADKSWEPYEFNNSPVGKFYAVANILLTYHEQSQTHILELPNMVNGFAITVLASNLSCDYDLENPRENPYDLIVLPSSLRKINSSSFAGIDAYNFDGQECAETLVDIADDAFGEDSEYIKNTTSEDGLIVLGKVLLRYKNTAAELDLTKIEKTKNITTIAKQAFMGTQFSKITLPNTLTYIADEAFLSNTNLSEINIPANVKSIGASAFQHCTGLKKVIFAENSAMEHIGASSFANCYNLTGINIPYTVTAIDENAFSNCITLRTVNFDKITETANPDTGDTVIEIINKSLLTSLGASAFQDCAALTSISIPNGLTEIKESTFKDCVSLVNVAFETDKSKVKVIRKEAFLGCVSLGSIIDVDNPSLITLSLPNALTHVEDSAFAGCEGLYGVAFNYNINRIGKEVFLGCLKLTKIEIYADTPPVLGENALMRARPTDEKQPYYNLRIYVKRDSKDKIYGDYLNYWSEYEANIFKIGNYASLTYQYTEGGSSLPPIVVPIDQLKDVYVNLKYSFPNRVEVTSWIFDQIDGGNTEIYGASRAKKLLGAEDYQRQHNPKTSTYDIILVVDYDMVLANALDS